MSKLVTTESDLSNPETIEGNDYGGIPDKMIKDAFIALSVGILSDGWISSDTKYFMFSAMFSDLEKIYSKKEVENLKLIMKNEAAKYGKTNSFMG